MAGAGSVLNGMGWEGSKSDIFTNGSSNQRDISVMFMGLGCFRRCSGFSLSFESAIGCMDELVCNMDMIRYEYLVCCDD